MPTGLVVRWRHRGLSLEIFTCCVEQEGLGVVWVWSCAGADVDVEVFG